MCGIVGFTTLRTQPDDAERVLRQMMGLVAHRGPDGKGTFSNPAIALGHCRLSIIDLEGGAQPMSTPDGRYTLIYNGEAYNYVELRTALERDGDGFRTRSDTEVVLQQYVRRGIDSFRDLNGMFAVAIWDRDKRELVLARDRIGVKPLYYCVSGGELVFASELKALLAHPGIERRIDLSGTSKYFSFGYVPTPHTIFKGVRKLAPGSYLRFGQDGLHCESYWDLPLDDDPPSGRNVDEWAEDVLALLRDSIAKRLRSDVPVGLFLSGGLDSSLVAALANQQSPDGLVSFSLGFDEASYDELPHARRVASHLGLEHHETTLTRGQAADIFPKVVDAFDEPLADASAIPTYALSQFASSKVKVVLGGDGADELFAGYPSFQADKAIGYLSFLPTSWRDSLGKLAQRLPASHNYASAEHLLRQFLKGRGLSSEVRFLLWMGCYSNSEKLSLFSESMRDELLRSDDFEDISYHVHRSGLRDSFQRLQYLCLKLYFQDRILVKVDRASMAHALEVRVPYLDRDLVEHACRIQPFYKLRGFTTKYVLKRAARAYLPPEIINRRKTGFMMPVASWLTHNMREVIEDVCSAEALGKTGIFNVAAARRVVEDHFSNRRDNRVQLYALLCFMAWFRRYQPAL
ncbi:MAG: asparagine synthase (glutamine-hydrolyzing) [Chthoniobacterales bacterium]